MLAPIAVFPIASMVVICALPMLSTGVTQERVATPSRCTVQAPHRAIPQPNFVPVIPSTSRNTHSKGVSPSTSTLCVVPLTLMVRATEQPPVPTTIIAAEADQLSALTTELAYVVSKATFNVARLVEATLQQF